jgi:integrase/recombinase XerD
MTQNDWSHYPHVARSQQARAWLDYESTGGRLAENSISTYARAINDYLRFCEEIDVDPLIVTREHIALYIHDLGERPNKRPHCRVRVSAQEQRSSISPQ